MLKIFISIRKLPLISTQPARLSGGAAVRIMAGLIEFKKNSARAGPLQRMLDFCGGPPLSVSAHVPYYIAALLLRRLSSFHITTLHTKPIMYTFVYWLYYLFVAQPRCSLPRPLQRHLPPPAANRSLSLPGIYKKRALNNGSGVDKHK